jgi:hypothetical protein
MSLSLTLLRDDLRTHLGMDVVDLPDLDADRLLNRSWWAMSSQLRFSEKDATHSFNTVAGTNSYALPTDSDAIQKVIIQPDGEEDWASLSKINDWNMFTLSANTEDEGFPTHYSRRDYNFILWPTPDDVYPASVKYLKTLQDIQSSGPEAPQEWHEVVLWGAISRGFFARGDWARGNAAQAQQAIYLQALDTHEDRDQEDKIYSGLRPLRRRYP